MKIYQVIILVAVILQKSASHKLQKQTSFIYDNTKKLTRSFEQTSKECKKLHGDKKFALKSFLDARKEIDLTTVSQSQISNYLHTFYGTDWGAQPFKYDGNLIVYARVFKGNSENIFSSLLRGENLLSGKQQREEISSKGQSWHIYEKAFTIHNINGIKDIFNKR
jgi:hypothetical protein